MFRKDPKALSIGSPPRSATTTHAVAMVMKEAGGESGTEGGGVHSSSKGMTALLGGHVDLYASSIDAAVPHVQAGRARALALAAEKRLRDEISTVPTWREQGVNVVASDMRLIVAPGKLTDAQISYWDDVFAKTVQSDEWRKFESAGYYVPIYLNSKDSIRYLDARHNLYRAILGELGLTKQ